MAAQATVNVCSDIVNVILDSVVMIAAKVCVQFCVHKKANTLMANVSAIQVGKEKNVRCVTMNAKWQIVMVTGIVLVANVNVFAATKENCVKTVGKKYQTQNLRIIIINNEINYAKL